MDKLRGLLADANIEGHIEHLVTSILLGDVWGDVWQELDLVIETFPRLNLPENAPDDIIWRLCQQEKLILLTANRNGDGDRSLEEVIRTESTLESLPVITIGNATRLIKSREYAERVGEALLDHILYIQNFLGAGRVYIP